MKGKRILLIVTGGIAAYKSAFLVRLLKRSGADVRVVMSGAASEFVTPMTFDVLSGNPVPRDMFAPRDKPGVEHVELAAWAERIVVAPATADFLAKAALGIGNDLASTLLLAARCPVLFAPSMNDAMWASPAVGRNIDMLKRDGRRFVETVSGELACGTEGPGRMAEPEEIVERLVSSFAPGDLEGLRFLVTAGRTEEEIDPVRYISNRSSGRMGFAIAGKAREMGARVTLIHGPVDVAPPEVYSVRSVRTAAEMKTAVLRAFPGHDVLIMAAAVADYTPVRRAASKIRKGKGGLSVELRPAVDVLEAVRKKKKKGQIVVGFALETDRGEKSALKKIESKGCDYLVLNMAGRDTGFSVTTNQVTLFKGKRRILATPVVSKEEAASAILGKVASDERLKRGVK